MEVSSRSSSLGEGGDLIGQEPPFPVPICGGRPVHPSLVPEAQNVLHGNDHRPGDRHHEKPDQFLRQVAGRDFPSQIAKEFPPLLRRCFTFKPSPQGVVVMRPCVGDAVRDVIVRQIRIGWQVSTEGKLEDAHPGKSEPAHDLNYFLGDQSQIFRDE